MADEPVRGEPVWRREFPASRENNREFYQKWGRCARIRPTERSKISLLEHNSPEIGTGNFIAQNREFIETSREFAASRRELPATASIQPQLKSSFANFSAREITLAPLRLQIRRLLGSSQASPSPVGRILGFRAGEIPGASITTSGITWPLGRRRAFRGRVAPKYHS